MVVATEAEIGREEGEAEGHGEACHPCMVVREEGKGLEGGRRGEDWREIERSNQAGRNRWVAERVGRLMWHVRGVWIHGVDALEFL